MSDAAPIVCDVRDCPNPPAWECGCPRCRREPDAVDRDHACAAHQAEVKVQHDRRTGRPVEWWSWRAR